MNNRFNVGAKKKQNVFNKSFIDYLKDRIKNGEDVFIQTSSYDDRFLISDGVWLFSIPNREYSSLMSKLKTTSEIRNNMTCNIAKDFDYSHKIDLSKYYDEFIHIEKEFSIKNTGFSFTKNETMMNIFKDVEDNKICINHEFLRFFNYDNIYTRGKGKRNPVYVMFSYNFCDYIEGFIMPIISSNLDEAIANLI